MDLGQLRHTLSGWLNTSLFTIGGEQLTIGRLIAAVLFLIGINLLSKYSDRWLHRVAPQRSTTLGRIHGFSKVIRFTIFSLGLLLFLEMIGVSVQSVFALIAALGVGIGFGLQNLINNFVSGFIILIESPIRVGDIIEVSGKFGRVVEIGVRATRMEDWDNVEILVPNSRILEDNLVNWTLTDGVSRIGIDLGVHYESNVEQVRTILLSVAEEHPLVVQEPEPVALLTNFGDSSIDFRLSVWTRTPWERNRIASDLRFQIFAEFHEYGVRIPYPQLDIHYPEAQ